MTTGGLDDVVRRHVNEHAAREWEWVDDARRLSGRRRWTMIALTYEAGLTQREIAESLGLSESAVAAEMASSMCEIAELVCKTG